MSEACKCRIPSPSNHHEFCINEECGLRIETIQEICTEYRAKIQSLEKRNALVEDALKTIEQLSYLGSDSFWKMSQVALQCRLKLKGDKNE